MRTFTLLVAAVASACGGESPDLALNVAWKFEAGDCASNQTETVRITWGPSGGSMADVEFPCTAGQGKVGDLSPMGGSYSIAAVGLDAAGVTRSRHLGTALTVGSAGRGGAPVDLTLRPKPADVVVTWRLSNGSGCPSGVVLPYFIGLYRPPAMMGGALTQKVSEKQASCSARTTTLTDVAPGDYVVELDSRAVTPMVKGSRAVTVNRGENAAVDFQL
ncbi:MAG: hypothetical protein IAE78_33565 [Myxococcus sp.]|nr:hypothetical protein [Myxococcus sp.]